jgi:hypothetical protein
MRVYRCSESIIDARSKCVSPIWDRRQGERPMLGSICLQLQDGETVIVIDLDEAKQIASILAWSPANAPAQPEAQSADE